MTDELLFKDLDIIEAIKAPYCLINNTLLSLYRDHQCFPQEQRECVVLLDANMRHSLRNRADANLDVFGVSGLGNINLNGKIAICFKSDIGDVVVINPYIDNFFVIEKQVFYPYATLEYKGRKIPIPHDPERYLELFYGEWKKPADNWNWLQSKSIIKAGSIGEALKKYNESPT